MNKELRGDDRGLLRLGGFWKPPDAGGQLDAVMRLGERSSLFGRGRLGSNGQNRWWDVVGGLELRW